MHRRVIFCRRKVFAASDQCAIQSKSPPRSLNPAKLQDFFKYQPTVPGELPEWRMRSSQTKTISESLAASRLSSVRTPPKNRQSKRAVLTRPDSSIKAAPSVFLNIPYDQGFSDLYLAYIAGAAAFGLVPRAAIEIPGGALRLNRIFALLLECRYSIHDVSRLEPRFGMPFELGLALAWSEFNESGRIVPRSEHIWFVFAANRRGIGKSLSDLLGVTRISTMDARRDYFANFAMPSFAQSGDQMSGKWTECSEA